MSYASFMASDSPMIEVDNPLAELLSVNEALAKGVDVPNLVLDSSTIDRDKPGVILWFDKEEDLGEITIRNAEKSWFRYDNGSFPETNLQHYSSLEWRYTEERANKLIKYIREHLDKANALEVWHTWIGSDRKESEVIKRRDIHINDLTSADFEEMFSDGKYDCIVVKRI